MPNHFHLIVLVNVITNGVASSDTVGIGKSDTVTTHASSDAATCSKKRSFNDLIGIMLRSYTNAVNKQQNRSGKLFREATKAECLSCIKGISPSFIINNGVTQFKVQHPEREYPKICFDYIHQNPVKAKLVLKETDWEFSSVRDYAGLRDGKLVNKNLAEVLGLT